jgi:predicted NodU family carbamoyl transferase
MITFNAIESEVESFHAATYSYDGTIRSQMVDQEWNPEYYNIILF